MEKPDNTGMPEKAATIDERKTPKGPRIDEVKERPKFRSSLFRPRPTLLLEIAPQQGAETAQVKEPASTNEKPEGMLQQLLINTESSAEKTQAASRKWQLASLVLVMLLTMTMVTIGWLYVEMNSATAQRGRLQMENQSLREELSSAKTQTAGLKSEVDTLLNRNLELAGENAQLKAQRQTAPATTTVMAVKQQRSAEKTSIAGTAKQQIEPNKTTAQPETLDTGRIGMIKRGRYPSGTNKGELIAALGKPDRVYKSPYYEQLVYFGKDPGRFWFLGNRLVQAGG